MKITTGKHLLIFLCILIMGSTVGCKKAQETPRLSAPATPAPAAAWPATRKTDRGNFTVTIEPSGGGITLHKHFSLAVVLVPGTGTEMPTAVSVNADMPSHGHGMNTTPETIHEQGPRYRTDGMLFHMAGEWSIMVEITAGAQIERAFFPVTVE